MILQVKDILDSLTLMNSVTMVVDKEVIKIPMYSGLDAENDRVHRIMLQDTISRYGNLKVKQVIATGVGQLTLLWNN